MQLNSAIIRQLEMNAPAPDTTAAVAEEEVDGRDELISSSVQDPVPVEETDLQITSSGNKLINV